MSKSTSKHANPAQAHPPGAKPSSHEDDLIVPKGVSRGTFLFLIGLIVFLMIIWIAPGALYSIGSRGADDMNPVQVRFELPSGGTVEWRGTDTIMQQRLLKDALEMDPFLAMQLGVDLRRPEPDDFVRLLVLDRVAQDAGIAITDNDLRAHLQSTFDFMRLTPEQWPLRLRGAGYSVSRIEGGIRRLLGVARFQNLVAFAGAVPDPKRIETLWHDENEELAFDYIALPVSRLEADARAELPDDEGLRAWFEELDEVAQQEFRTSEKRTAALAVFPATASAAPQALLDAYPEVLPEGVEPTDPEELARRYYDTVFTRRFRKPAPADGEEGAPVVTGFQSFEEVLDVCTMEARVWFAMQRWIEDLAARKAAGEALDFQAEAERLGLEFQAFPEALARDAFKGDDGFRAHNVGNAVFTTPPDGSFHPSVEATRDGLAVVRVTGLTAPELPPFEDIRERVAEAWIEPRARELGLERLEALREGFESFEPPVDEDEQDLLAAETGDHYRAAEDVFRTTAESFGYEVKRRDWLNKAGPATIDPLWENEDHRALFAQARMAGLNDLEADEVAEPFTSMDQETHYLVRLAGRRDVPLENMSPTQYDRYKRTARQREIAEIGDTLGMDFLRDSYGLWVKPPDSEAGAQPVDG